MKHARAKGIAERPRTKPRRGLVLVALLSACGPAKRPPTSPPGTSGAAATPGSNAEAPCPVIDYAALELEPEADARTIALTRVFQRDEARASVVTVPARLELDVIRVPRPVPPSKLGGGIGMGWQGLEASWVAGATSPELEAPLAAWLAAWDEQVERMSGSYLLDTRARYAQSIEPPAAWGGRRCVEEAAVQAERDEQQAEAATRAATVALQAALEALPSRRPGDELVLGYLLESQLESLYDPKAAERPRALLSKVASDETAGRELRARAAEQLARLQEVDSEGFVRSLEQVLSLTQDSELAVETLVKLADVAAQAGDAAKAEALRVKVLERLGPTPHEDSRWRVSQTLALLAEARLERGAYELALDDAARCARESGGVIEHDPDPWGCAPVLAEALAELAQPPADVTVPLPFLGPLALASMQSALERRDHQQAEHVGRLLLAELPLAAQAPQVLVTLAELVQSNDARTELLEPRPRRFGPESEWTATQRRRLAWTNEPAAVERLLVALREPSPTPGILHRPTTPLELTADLRERAALVGQACVDVLPKGRAVRIEVDTIAAVPVATVRKAKPKAAACLRRATQARFRSVGPVQASFGLALE